MKFRTAVFGLALLGAACSSVKTAPIYAGDTCFRCRRIIEDPKLAAEIIDSGGRAFKFRTTGCVAKYLSDHPSEVTASKVFVTDFHSGRFISSKVAIFVPMTIGEGSSRERDYAAFSAASEARKLAEKQLSQPTDWAGVLKGAASAN